MLTPKQACFVAEYLVDLNATQAAIRAGYSVKTANRIATENLSKPVIRDALKAAMEDREKRTEITQDRVLKELAKIGFADIRKALKWGESIAIRDPESGELTIAHGISMIPSNQIDDDTAAAISEIAETNQGLKVKLHDKQAALVSMARHLGMFVEKNITELTVKKSTADMTDEELAQEAARHGLKL